MREFDGFERIIIDLAVDDTDIKNELLSRDAFPSPNRDVVASLLALQLTKQEMLAVCEHYGIEPNTGATGGDGIEDQALEEAMCKLRRLDPMVWNYLAWSPDQLKNELNALKKEAKKYWDLAKKTEEHITDVRYILTRMQDLS